MSRLHTIVLALGVIGPGCGPFYGEIGPTGGLDSRTDGGPRTNSTTPPTPSTPATPDAAIETGGNPSTAPPVADAGVTPGGGPDGPPADAGRNPPVVVTVQPCSNLAASTGWEKITPPGDLGDSQAFQLDPIHVGTIYIQMHKGGNGNHAPTDGIYTSSDCGSTWRRVAQGRNSSDPGVNINSGSFSSMIIDPVDSNIMYIVSNYGPGGVWKSVNAGVDWDQVVPQSVGQYVNYLWFNALTIDPTDHNHLVAANHAGCSGPYSPNCLVETRDAGATWNLVALPVGSAEGNGVYILNSTTMLFATNQNGVIVTTNRGAAWTMVGNGAIGAGTGYPAYQATDGTYYIASSYGILSSRDFRTWTNINNGQYRQLTGTGVNLISTSWYSFTYWKAAESAPSSWSQLSAPGAPTGGNGGVYMTYDREHHLLYTSNYDVGFWRLVTM